MYIQHNIAAAGITIFAAFQIMAVSGHKPVSGLAVYLLVGDLETLGMGGALSAKITPTIP